MFKAEDTNMWSEYFIWRLAYIDRQAQECSHQAHENMKQAQSIMEQLKAENALEWTGQLNNIRACAREIVNKEFCILRKMAGVKNSAIFVLKIRLEFCF